MHATQVSYKTDFLPLVFDINAKFSMAAYSLREWRQLTTILTTDIRTLFVAAILIDKKVNQVYVLERLAKSS